MTRKAAAKNSRLLGEKKARVLVEFVLIIYRVLLFSYLSERERTYLSLSLDIYTYISSHQRYAFVLLSFNSFARLSLIHSFVKTQMHFPLILWRVRH